MLVAERLRLEPDNRSKKEASESLARWKNALLFTSSL